MKRYEGLRAKSIEENRPRWYGYIKKMSEKRITREMYDATPLTRLEAGLEIT